MIDFRSDTLTQPTPAMREAMYQAVVGDDVYEEDPTLKTLEDTAARMLDKEAALFVPSGTMGNQLAIMAHTARGDEIIVGSRSHIKNYEVGAAAVLSAVSFHLIEEQRGILPLDAIEKGIRRDDIHHPKTGLICLENAHGTGVVIPLDAMQAIYHLATTHTIPVHLDGARLFNAATHLNCSPKAIAQYADSVMFCLSKGLSAPVGSLLVGSCAFIHRARKYRKMLGGGMRQAGVLGAAGLLALKTMITRLETDHQNARYLAKQLSTLPGFTVDFDALDINMVFVKTTYDRVKLHQALLEQGIHLGAYKGDTMRLVCHHDIRQDDIDTFMDALRTTIELM
ncbi:MAG: low-specificity L-threonine aldolase [Acholeplasmatales bacterium]|nr:MAG: low-specificity L-threonine aldolase [Acholeplasmatales bacterium]